MDQLVSRLLSLMEKLSTSEQIKQTLVAQVKSEGITKSLLAQGK